MKKYVIMLLGLATTLAVSLPSFAGGGGAIGSRFVKQIYVKYGGSATNSGTSYDAAKSCAADGDLWDIPAGVVIDKVYVIIDTLVTGSSDLDIGDDDDADGFVDGSLSVTLGTVGLYGWNAKTAGAYLRVQTAGATDAADVYVVPAAKYYSAAGKEVKQDITTACTAGKYRVVVEGFYAGTK
jgi:hypothetical protein